MERILHRGQWALVVFFLLKFHLPATATEPAASKIDLLADLQADAKISWQQRHHFYNNQELPPTPEMNIEIRLLGRAAAMASAYGELAMDRFRDEKGKILDIDWESYAARQKGEADGMRSGGRWLDKAQGPANPWGSPYNNLKFSINIEDPPPLKNFSEIRGRITLRTGGRYQIVSIENIAKHADRSIENETLAALGIELKIDREKSADQPAPATAVPQPAPIPPATTAGSGSADPVAPAASFSFSLTPPPAVDHMMIVGTWKGKNAITACELTDSLGRPLKNMGASGGPEGKKYSLTISASQPIPDDARLRVTVHQDPQTITVPFVVKDVEVPSLDTMQKSTMTFSWTPAPATSEPSAAVPAPAPSAEPANDSPEMSWARSQVGNGWFPVQSPDDSTVDDTVNSLNVTAVFPLNEAQVRSWNRFYGDIDLQVQYRPRTDAERINPDLTALGRISRLGRLTLMVMHSKEKIEKPILRDGVEGLKNHPHLTSIFINGFEISPEAARAIASLPAVKGIYFLNCKFPKDALSELQTMKSLRRLDLSDSQFSDASLAALANCPNLQHLIVQRSPATAAAFAPSGGWKKLEVLDVSGTRIDGKGLVALGQCPKLWALNAAGVTLTAEDIQKLAGPGRLKILVVGTKTSLAAVPQEIKKRLKFISADPESPIDWTLLTPPTDSNDRRTHVMIWLPCGLRNDDDLKSLRSLRDVQADVFDSCSIFEVPFENLPKDVLLQLGVFHRVELHGPFGENSFSAPGGLTDPAVRQWVEKFDGEFQQVLQDWGKTGRLEELELVGCPIGPKSLARLAEMKKLKSLSLMGTGAGDAVGELLANLPNLEELRLREWNIGDRGVQSLSKSKSLKRLDLSGTEMTDAGIDALLKMPSLKDVLLFESKVSKQSAERLKARKIFVTHSPRSQDPGNIYRGGNTLPWGGWESLNPAAKPADK